MDNEDESRPCDLNISWSTIFKVLAGILIVLAILRIARFLELIALSALLGIALRPVFNWAAQRGWPKWIGVWLCAMILFGAAAVVLATVVPLAATEGAQAIQHIPEYKTNLLQHLPQSGPLKDISENLTSGEAFSHSETLVKKAVAWGGSGLQVLAGFMAVLVLAVYFVADGERAYAWLTAFLPKEKREQLNLSKHEITTVVSHYVAGSAFTALLCALYAFTVLSILRVPNAALLAMIAGVFDVLPIIGFFLFTIPAVLVALTVSAENAIFVFVLFGAYHLTEAYFIVPHVYGNRLKLSGLAVLVCCLAAGLLGGVVAIILALPLAASYPIVERIWLQPYLEEGTVRKHRQLEVEAGAKAEEPSKNQSGAG